MSNYNGYSNRETWATILNIYENESLYSSTRNLQYDYSGNQLGIMLRDCVYQYFNKDLCVDVLEDIGDVSQVNWSEVADSLKGERS